MRSMTLRMRASVFETSGDFFRVQLRMTALSGASVVLGSGVMETPGVGCRHMRRVYPAAAPRPDERR